VEILPKEGLVPVDQPPTPSQLSNRGRVKLGGQALDGGSRRLRVHRRVEVGTHEGTDLNLVGLEQVRLVAAEMNGRPLKVLGWRTPAEVYVDVVATAA